VFAAVLEKAELSGFRVYDLRHGHQSGTKSKSGTSSESEVPDSSGGPSRTRTLDPLIKRPFRAILSGLTPSRSVVFRRTHLRVVSSLSLFERHALTLTG
jgi:hypothetical protein